MKHAGKSSKECDCAFCVYCRIIGDYQTDDLLPDDFKALNLAEAFCNGSLETAFADEIRALIVMEDSNSALKFRDFLGLIRQSSFAMGVATGLKFVAMEKTLDKNAEGE